MYPFKTYLYRNLDANSTQITNQLPAIKKELNSIRIIAQQCLLEYIPYLQSIQLEGMDGQPFTQKRPTL